MFDPKAARLKALKALSDAILRCYKKDHPDFKGYGWRGIWVCKRWRESKEAFLEDMGLPPSRAHSLERLNPNGPYSPENCIWSTWAVQNRNRRNSVRYSFNGKELCLKDWAKELGLPFGLLYKRIRVRMWSVEDALTMPRNAKLSR